MKEARGGPTVQRRRIHTFEADGDVQILLEAVDSNGIKKRFVINKALRLYLPEVVGKRPKHVDA